MKDDGPTDRGNPAGRTGRARRRPQAGRADRRSAGARDLSRRTPSRRAGGAPRKTYPVSRRRRYGHSRAQGGNRAAPRQAARRFGQNPRGQARGRLDGRTPSPQDRHPDARPGLNLLHGRYRDGRQSRYRPPTLPLRPARLPRSRTPPFRRCRPQGHPRRRCALDLVCCVRRYVAWSPQAPLKSGPDLDFTQHNNSADHVRIPLRKEIRTCSNNFSDTPA